MSFLTPARSALLVVVAALAVYGGALGNGFAGDDTFVVSGNPVVTEGRVDQALGAPYWPEAEPGTGNWRPVTLTSFAAEWRLWDGSPAGFHAVNVVVHAGVSLLVFVLLLQMVGTLGALAGGLVFAVHPVHVEAVAQVVGRAELYAAAAVLGAVLLHWRGSGWTGGARALRLVAVAGLYAVGLGSKEMAVTLPGLLLLVDVVARHGEGKGPVDRVVRELPTYLTLAAVLATYLILRLSVLGAFTGESAAAGLRSLSTGERLLSALSIWPHYLRLMLAPVELSMDYAPGVLRPATGVDLRVVAGAAILGGVLWGAWHLARREPLVSLGLGWFFVAVLPVSNLVVRSDILLAERTLYLPSVGLALVVAGLVPILRREAGGGRLRGAAVLGVVAVAALAARTVSRIPAWADSATAIQTLVEEHPESYRASLVYANLQKQRGDAQGAAVAYREALSLAPDSYLVLVESAVFFGRAGDAEQAERLFRRAVALNPDHPAGWGRWGEHLLRTGQGRRAHGVALEGLKRVGADRQLLAVLSESYVAKGDLEAALRARRAAALRPDASANDWRRLAELLEALDRPEAAEAARARAADLPQAPPAEVIR